MKKMYKQVLDKMSEIALSGVSESVVDSVYEVATQARKYPLCIIDPLYKPHTYQNGLLNLKIDLYFVDLIYQDRSNELDVSSDMVSTAIPYVNYLRDKEDELGFYFRKDTGTIINFEVFTMRWADFVSGVKITLDISIPDDGSLCSNFYS